MSAPTIAQPAPSLPPLRIGPAKAVRHGITLAGRGIAKFAKSPLQLTDVILTPILMLVMFVYLFGGAIGGGHTHAYIETLVPGIMVITVLQASMGIGVALTTDASTGVFDRFRAMPIARSAPLIGAVLADLVRYVIALVTLFGLALIMGYRTGANPAALAGAAVLLVAFGLSFAWLSVFLGMLVKSPSAVYGIMSIAVLPFTFASNVFVAPKTMPGWLKAWSGVNPVSVMTDTMRGLLGGGDVAGPLTGALIWMAAAIVIFFPLSMRAYRRSAT
ncbi:ABC transporter permease [Actinoallomurus acanthiterrae]